MKTLMIAIVICIAFTTAQAETLRVVEVSSRSVNCLFDPTCRVVASDSTDSIALPTGGSNFLQTRVLRGSAGSAASGLYAYEYRVDLRRAEGILNVPCLTSLTINFGPIVDTLDFNGDGKSTDQVFVITRGGLGSVGLASAVQEGNRVTFNFSVCAGGRPGTGESTYFFGLVSRNAPQRTTAKLIDNSADEYSAAVRAPKKSSSSDVRDSIVGKNSVDTFPTRFLTTNLRIDRPVVEYLEPRPCVDRGGTVKIYGSGFGAQRGNRLVELGGHGIGVLLKVTSWSSKLITAIVPDNPRIQFGQWYYVGLQNQDRHWISNISRNITICGQLQ